MLVMRNKPAMAREEHEGAAAAPHYEKGEYQ